MNKLTVSLVALFLSVWLATGEAKDKAKDQAPTYANNKTFEYSCDTIWGKALTVLSQNQFNIINTDKVGGVINFTSNGAGRNIKGYTNAGKAGKLSAWNGYRINSGTFLLQGDEKCSCTVNLVYSGLKGTFGGIYEWVGVQSNNRYESLMLEGIATDLLLNEVNKEIQQKK